MMELATSRADDSVLTYDSWTLAEHYLAPLMPLFEDPSITEIMVNRYDEVFVEREGKMERVEVAFESDEAVSECIRQVANALGQVADPLTAPELSARLRDGSRIQAYFKEVAVRGASITIRVAPKKRMSLDDLLKREALTPAMLAYLELAILTGCNGIVSGSTNSGKTTLLNLLGSLIPDEDRVVTVEDTHELVVNAPNRVHLEAPQRGHMEHRDVITLARLLRGTLRLSPTRIIVGEIRDGEAATAFTQAINTGHTGTFTTLHANNCEDALTRLQILVAEKNESLGFDVIREIVRGNIHVVAHATKTRRHGRRITELGEVRNGKVVPLWRWDYARGAHIENSDAVANSLVIAMARLHGYSNIKVSA